jgi:cytochrome P450
VTMTRKLLRAHTFSDGTRVPAGAIVGVPTLPHQLDRATYESPHVVDPFRFEHAKDKDGEVAHKHFTSCDSAYLPFGAGKQACPGRFFASIELKAMLSYLLLHYDVRAEAEGVRPADIYIQHAIIPVQAKVLFRKRQL